MVQVVINPPRAKIANPDGTVSTEWYRFFVSIQKLLGGNSGGGDPFDDAILISTSAAVAAVERNEDDFPGFGRTPGVLTASAGLTGGGDMEGNISVSVGAGLGITVNANDVALDTTHVRNVDHSAVSLTAGAGLTGGGDITASRTFDVGAGTGITVNANDVALDTASTRNTDHASVTLTAGNGLTGGGDITTSRSFAVGAGTGISVTADAVSVADTAVTPGAYGSATSVPSFTVDQQGRLTAASGNTIPALESGTYTPTITGVLNVDGATPYTAQYLRVGNTVTVAGLFDVDPTAASSTQVGISLPVASNFNNTIQCGGTAAAMAYNVVGAFSADTTNDRADLVFLPTATSNQAWSYTFTYRVI